MVKRAHSSLNPQFSNDAHILLDLYYKLIGIIVSIVDNISIDSSLISKIFRHS